MLMIQNLESQYPGTWSVDANYTIKDYGFNKEPITHTIGANTSQVFDFNQIYNPGNPITSAICTLVVSVEPIIQECVEVTRAKTECKNVTKTVTTQQQVCD
jgi:hypothetical protein